jgi:thiosulfate/3-mercaptopyruvate sulfurtransferase
MLPVRPAAPAPFSTPRQSLSSTLRRGWQHLRAFVLACALGTMAAGAIAAAPAGRLVDAAWLQQNRAEVLLLDASVTPQHRAGHIAGAVSADLYRYGSDDATPAAMEQRMQAWGLSPGRKVVVYDQGGDWMAARLFHDLYVHGVPAQDLLLLDGGLARWKAQGGAVTTEATPPPPRGSWRVGALRDQERVRLPEFLVASGDRERHVLVDALGPDYYYGQRKFFDRNGHVPGALLLPSEDFFNADKTFKSPDEVRRLLRYHGIRPEQEVHSHCGGGGAAAVPWFALRFLAGHANVRLYLGSQREWLRDDRGLPMWSYAAPQMLRDPAWLAGWNAPMLRMFGASRLNVVDVRSAVAYAQGHLPFAVNLPGEVFRSHLGHPETLAALLGPAGVQPAHEVVLVSEQGLSPAAALAFVALDQLGHEKLSLLTVSVDEWGLRGLELTRQPTIVGAPERPTDTAVPPASYAARPARAVLAGSATPARGEFPRVFVAAGSAAPTAAPAGPLLALPYTELLGPGGLPKPAAELWKIISKAGVPRLAEVVLVADDPAEAAVGYVVLKLMGWPDVRIWTR